MTNKEKIERVIEWITCGHLYCDGGYPFDYEIVDGRMFVAELEDSGRTHIAVYDYSDFVDWYNRAEAWLKTSDDVNMSWPKFCGLDYGDWDEALWETKADIDKF